MKTLLLNPPSFKNFDGGASSRWPATREIASYWYPVWLTYPAGMLPGSRLLDAPPHGITPEQTVEIARSYEFVVLFTSTVGFANDVGLARMMKQAKPDLKIAFVGPHVQIKPDCLVNNPEIDFIVTGEFDHSIVEFAEGKPVDQIAGAGYRQNGGIHLNPPRPSLQTEDLDRLPFATEVFKRDLVIENYNVPFLLHPYVAFYTSRGCPALCTFCLWPQTLSGHPWRVRSSDNVAREVKQALQLFPQAKELFFDDDTFPWAKDRTIELCKALKPLKFTWSCNSRVTAGYETLKAMKEAGCRLLIVGFESGDPQILKNIKKGATVEQAREFMKHCRKLGLVVHGDFQVGHPGETPETIERTIQFAMELDPETIQVSMSHPYPGTEFDAYLKKHNYAVDTVMTDEQGHQLPVFQYPGLSRRDIMDAVERFYDRYYFRPHVIFRILRRAVFDRNDRSRLYVEAKAFLKVRAKRKEFVRTPVGA